jgi:hypothetical protein
MINHALLRFPLGIPSIELRIGSSSSDPQVIQ